MATQDKRNFKDTNEQNFWEYMLSSILSGNPDITTNAAAKKADFLVIERRERSGILDSNEFVHDDW